MLAATLWAGEGAVVSHDSALAVWRGQRDVKGDVEVSTVNRRDSREGVCVHRIRWLAARDVVVRDGVPVTTPERTVLDLAGVLDARALEALVESLLSEALVSLKSLLKQVLAVRSRWVPGRARLRRCLLSLVRRAVGERMADATDALLLRAGLDVPARNHLAAHEGGKPIHAPLAFPALRLALVPYDFSLPQEQRWVHWPRDAALKRANWEVQTLDFRRLVKRFVANSRRVRWAFHRLAGTPPTIPDFIWKMRRARAESARSPS
jgi:hypothetical protein